MQHAVTRNKPRPTESQCKGQRLAQDSQQQHLPIRSSQPSPHVLSRQKCFSHWLPWWQMRRVTRLCRSCYVHVQCCYPEPSLQFSSVATQRAFALMALGSMHKIQHLLSNPDCIAQILLLEMLTSLSIGELGWSGRSHAIRKSKISTGVQCHPL